MSNLICGKAAVGGNYNLTHDNCWIIREVDGNIRVWYPDSEETFFGKDKEIVFERMAEREEYIKIAV